MEAVPFDYEAFFDKMVIYSDSVTKLYKLLSQIEMTLGTNSEQYKKVVAQLEKAIDCENNSLNLIYKDLSVLYLFKDYIRNIDCTRLVERLYTDERGSKLIFFSEANDKYDELYENYVTSVPRNDFIKVEYDAYGKEIVRNNIFYLQQMKKLVTILDYYLSTEPEGRKRNYLIKIKNETLQNHKALEEWYFGFKNTDLQAMLVDVDGLIADHLGIPENKYLNMKNNHFFSVIDDLFAQLFEVKDNSEDVKTVYELNVIAALLNMNVLGIDNSYRFISKEYGNSEDDQMEFVDNVYSKCISLEKKLRFNEPKEDM